MPNIHRFAKVKKVKSYSPHLLIFVRNPTDVYIPTKSNFWANCRLHWLLVFCKNNKQTRKCWQKCILLWKIFTIKNPANARVNWNEQTTYIQKWFLLWFFTKVQLPLVATPKKQFCRITATTYTATLNATINVKILYWNLSHWHMCDCCRQQLQLQPNRYRWRHGYYWQPI